MHLPESFTTYTRQLFGEERYERFVEALSQQAPVSIRLNTAKLEAIALRGGSKQIVPHEAIVKGQVPWARHGYYLCERPNFTADPLLHAGCYYVQEASSMFVEHVLREHLPEGCTQALDLCAAPGGKSTAMRAILPDGCTLMSNEPDGKRAQILMENMQKWGYDGCMVTSNYPEQIARTGMLFDVILCDVPCSGEGLFRKDPNAVSEWSPQNVERCASLQRQIVSQAWRCLRDGGLLVYSTCTYNTRENEENVRWIEQELGAEVLPVSHPDSWGITGSLLPDYDAPVCRFIPGITNGEGLFMAALRKPGKGKAGKGNDKRKRDLRILWDGATPPINKGRDLIPQHAEALKISSRARIYNIVELDYPTAISYLRHESIVMPEGTPRGYNIVAFMGAPLGFVKNIGNRANNLYPKEWRIRSISPS